MACVITSKDGFICLQGTLDDTVDLKGFGSIYGPVRLQLRSLEGATSVGLSRLIGLTMSGIAKVEYHEVPLFFLDSLAAIPSLLGPKGDPKVVKSVIGDFACANCSRELHSLIDLAKVQIVQNAVFIPTIDCTACHVLMRVDFRTQLSLDDFLTSS